MIPNRKAAVAGVFLCLLARSFAQPGTITTFAGGYPEGIPGPALQTALVNPGRLAEDAAGNIYIMGWAYIYRLSPDGRITTFAGTGVRGFSGDGGAATGARINPAGANWASLLVDDQGNLIFTDSGNQRIRKIEPTGLISTIAGTGALGFGGDDGPALAAQLNFPYGLAKDSQGNIYFGDTDNHRVRKITPGGTISTVAGDGVPAYRGDGGPARQSSLNRPTDVVFDSAGNLYILDRNNIVVRKVRADGMISTAASSSSPGSPPNTAWSSLDALAVDKSDNLYISSASRVLKMDPSGRVSIFLGNGQSTLSEYRGPALQANVGHPRGLLADSKGNIVMGFAILNGRIGKVDPAGDFSWIAGVSSIAGADGPPAFARIYLSGALAFDPGGTLYSDEFTIGVMKLTPTAMTRLSVNVGSLGVQGMTFDSAGNLYRTDASSDTIRKIDPAGVSTLFAGRATPFPQEGGFGGDGGPATDAQFYNPRGVVFGPDGSLYVGDSLNNRVRKIAPNGIISTFAGTGIAGASGDGGIATAAQLNQPSFLAMDSGGNLYISDAGNSRIRKVSPDGLITTFAGTGVSGFSGDGGPANLARIGGPRAITMDAADNLYIIDGNNGRVRKVTSRGIISTVAGSGGGAGYGGDGGPAVNATLNTPQGLAVDVNGNLYIGDTENHRIRRVEGSVPFTAIPATLLFSSTLNGAAKSQLVTVTTTDGSPRRFQVRTNVPWLSAAPDSGTVDRTTFGKVIVTANPTGRAKGTFPGLITIVDLDSGGATSVPVTLTVSGTAQQLRLSQVGLTFTAVQGGAAPPAQSFQVVNAGAGAMPWTQTFATLAGGSTWLSATPASGTSTAGATPAAIIVSVNPTGLPAGAYYGQVNVAAAGADNSPQSAIVLLRILPADGTPGPSLDPSGLLYTATPTANPPAQSFTLANSSARTINYTAALRYTSGTGWLTAPAGGSLTGGQSRTLDLQPRSTTLAAGVYRATITFTFTPDNVTRVLDIALVVNPAAPSADAPLTRNADPACAAKQLVAVIRRPGASYQTAAGWPVPMEAAVVDDCGAPMTTGRVLATFSSNDPAVPLQHSASGFWQATWASRTTGAAGNVTIRVAAESIDQSLAGTAQVIIRSDLNPDQPSINPGGVLNAASFSSTTPVPVGGYVSVFGSRLSKEFQLATSLPLPGSLGETSVFLGGRLAPLHFASDGQVNAILPYSVADNTTHQMIVRRGNIPSLPEPVLVASVQPAVFSYDGSGKGQGHIYVARADGTFLADAAHPVKPGDVILFYATGLGPVNPPVVEGRPAPGDPLSLPVNPIAVSIQGKDARVVFAGLAPGFAGVYQVNAIAPDGITADPSTTLVVSSGGQPSPAVNMAVTP